MVRKAVVIGGSIGGLFAASMLRTNGWTVDVFDPDRVKSVMNITPNVRSEAIRSLAANGKRIPQGKGKI